MCVQVTIQMEKPNRCRDRDRDSDSDLDLDSDLVVSDSLLPESNLDAPDVSTPGRRARCSAGSI